MSGSSRLSDQFEMRFVIGRVLWFLPLLVVVGVLVWMSNSPLRNLILAKYVVVIGLIAWTSFRKAGNERFRIERVAKEHGGVAIDHAGSHAWPLLCGAILAGALWALVRWDIRWLYLAVGLALIGGVGLKLRWLIYERWVIAQLRAL